MSYLSVDELIERLVSMKEQGVAGTDPVFIPSSDNNARGGFMSRVEKVAMVPVAKADMDKGFSLCKVVSSRGVPVVVIR